MEPASFYAMSQSSMCGFNFGRYALAIIDGTGDWSDSDYHSGMDNSFCRQMYRALPSESYYQRGPSLEGGMTRRKGDDAGRWLISRQTFGVERLFIAGYSRGGSAAIYAANMLKQHGLMVDGLFLFDPVARHPFSGGAGIPSNVLKCWISWREDDAALISKYAPPYGYTNPIRPSFGHMNAAPEGRTLIAEQRVRASHGALGGVGWATVSEDKAAQLRVQDFMNDAFVSTRLPIVLKAVDPTGRLSWWDKAKEAAVMAAVDASPVARVARRLILPDGM